SSRLDQLDQGLQKLVADSKQASLPILNQPLSAVADAGKAVSQFKDRVVGALRGIPDGTLTNAQAATAIRDALYKELTQVDVKKDKVAVLGDTNTDNVITKDDVIVTNVNLATGNVTIEVRLTAVKDLATQPFKFGLGLNGIPLEIEQSGELVVSAGFDYKSLHF